MPEQKVKIKSLCKYNGHSVKANKSVDISFKFMYSELTNYIKLIQLLNENIEISIKIEDEKAQKLGTFMIRGIGIDHDGEGNIKFNSQLDFIEPNVINEIAGKTLQILFVANIDVED